MPDTVTLLLLLAARTGTAAVTATGRLEAATNPTGTLEATTRIGTLEAGP